MRMRQEAMDLEEAEEYFERSARFRDLVMQSDPTVSPRDPLMRYPGGGNREERRADKARARRARTAWRSKHAE